MAIDLTNVSAHVASERTLEAVLKRIDCNARTLLDFIQECGREGQWGKLTQKELISSYNTLVILRLEMTKAGLAAIACWDNSGIEATKRVCVDHNEKGEPLLRFFE